MILLLLSQYDWESQEYYYEEVRRKGKYVFFAGGYLLYPVGEKPHAPFGYLGIKTSRLSDPRAYFTFIVGGGYSLTHPLYFGEGGILYERRTQRFGGILAFHLGIGLVAGYYVWDDDAYLLADTGLTNTSPIMFNFPVKASFSVRLGSFEVVPEVQAVPSVDLKMNETVSFRGLIYVMYGPESEPEFFEATRKEEERKYRRLR